MTLLEIRTLFINHSGRFDLVVNTTSYADNGADFFIQTGQKVLDDMSDITKQDALIEQTLSAGTELVKISSARFIDQVHILNENEDEKQFLTRLFYHDFLEKYNENTDDGVPSNYAIKPLRVNGAVESDIQSEGIVVGPVPDVDYDLVIKVRLKSHALEDDADISFWSVEYPHTLLQASLYALERFYRNTQGMQDHMRAIQLDLQGIDHDEVENMTQLRSNMNDSFNELSNRKLRSWRP